MNGFEGSFLGNKARIDAGTRLECGVCWWVYDPDEGDAVWQIPPGTAFAELPAYWRCPNCDAAASQFMVLARGRDPQATQLRTTRAAQGLADLGTLLVSNYSRVAARMRGLAVYNTALAVDAPAVCRSEHGPVVVLCTPWCMNLLLFADDADRLREGSVREHRFPSGSYPFTACFLDGVGHFEACSLFSPMDQFAGQDAVVAVARECLAALMRCEAGDAQSEHHDRPNLERRRLLRLSAAP